MKTKHSASRFNSPQIACFKTPFQWLTVASIAMMLILSTATSRATTESFTNSTTWICPAGITNVTVECWGGGGAGGSVTNASNSGGSGTSTVGGGGAGGAYSMKTNLSVTPGNSYTVSVGDGGTPPALPPTEGARGDGGDSWFNTSATVLAKGGGGGMSKNAARPAAGTGGTNLLGSIGDVINLGGLGGNGDGNLQAAGGGGGSGGTSSAGNNGSVTNGAVAVPGGGTGGNGRASGTSGAGNPGGIPGGGGGGADAAANIAARLGGAGAVGKIAITYIFPAPRYTWVATSGSADWNVAGNWTPNRNSPATNDILLFNQAGNSTATNVPTQTIGKFQVSNGTIINLQSDSTNALIVGETVADALTVESGSQLNDNGTNSLLISLSPGAKGSISGSMTFSNAAHTLTASEASGITFNSGAVFTQNCLGNIFGSGTANSVVFASGSTFTQFTGGNPFQKAQPASVVVFQTGSLFRCLGNTAPSSSGRTYADFECNETNLTVSATGASPLTISNLTVAQNAFTVSMGGVFNLNGNASVTSGATLNLNNAVTTASGKTVTVNGTLAGTATISGGATVAISSAGTLSPAGASIGTLTFATAPAFGGTNFMQIDRNGGSPLADKVVVTSGTLNYGGTLVVTNIGDPALQLDDTFTLFSAPVLNNSFGAMQLPGLPNGFTWDTSQLNINGTIKVAVSTSPPQTMSINIQNGRNVISWTNSTFFLLSSTNVTGPYLGVPEATSPYTNTFSDRQRYFRLVHTNN